MGLKTGDTVLGRYEVQSLLGRGGMGEVHRGRHQLLGHTVALKVLTDTSPETEKRFLREAKLMALVRSPYIVSILDFGHTPDNLPCIAMEFIEGEELGTRLGRSGAVPWTEAAALARDIAHGLQALHAVDVLHRDLKPANIVVAPGPPQIAKIIDFGIARPTGNADATRMTSTGALVGTPAYMAPEQLMGLALDPRSDIYAVGLILHEMLTGQLPFAGRDMAAVIRRLQSSAQRAEAPAGVPKIPAALQQLVLQCLSTDPDGRPRTSAELVLRLEGVLRPATAGRTSGVVPTEPSVDIDGATGIATDADLWQATANEMLATSNQRPATPPSGGWPQQTPGPASWPQSGPQTGQQNGPPTYPQQLTTQQTQAQQMYMQQMQAQHMAAQQLAAQQMAMQAGWAPMPQPQMWTDAYGNPQTWPPGSGYAMPNPYGQAPQPNPAMMQPWVQTPMPRPPSGAQQFGPPVVPDAAGVRYLVVAKLPPSKLALPEERRWLASILGHHGRSFTFGSQFWFALQVVPSPANDAGVAARAILQKLAERYPNQATQKVRFMPAEFSLNAAQLTGAQPLPATLAEMLNELG